MCASCEKRQCMATRMPLTSWSVVTSICIEAKHTMAAEIWQSCETSGIFVQDMWRSRSKTPRLLELGRLELACFVDDIFLECTAPFACWQLWTTVDAGCCQDTAFSWNSFTTRKFSMPNSLSQMFLRSSHQQPDQFRHLDSTTCGSQNTTIQQTYKASKAQTNIFYTSKSNKFSCSSFCLLPLLAPPIFVWHYMGLRLVCILTLSPLLCAAAAFVVDFESCHAWNKMETLFQFSTTVWLTLFFDGECNGT